ncbi:hypothetical protein D3C80_736780 [compost metagenome]
MDDGVEAVAHRVVGDLDGQVVVCCKFAAVVGNALGPRPNIELVGNALTDPAHHFVAIDADHIAALGNRLIDQRLDFLGRVKLDRRLQQNRVAVIPANGDEKHFIFADCVSWLGHLLILSG